MYKKKLSTIAIVTILTLSMVLAAIPMAYAAIGTPVLTPNTGDVGTKITVAGVTATAFGQVEVYWDTLATKIKDGYATSGGAYSITKVTIPEGIVGVHDIIVYDVLSSTISSAQFTITTEIDISTDQGLPGDSVTVDGTGFGDELDTSIYLGAITSIGAESVTITAGTPDTGTLAQTPVVIGSVTLTCGVSITGTVLALPQTGTATVTVTDDGEGNLAGSTADIAVGTGEVDVTITGTINYATGVITLTASGVDSAGTNPVTVIGVTIDTPCSAAYNYAEYDVTPVAGLTTSDVGSFEAVVIIPAIAVGSYGAFDVTAFDTDGNTDAYVTLTVDYYLTVSPTSGPTGITITISGRIPASTAYELRIGTVTILTGTSAADTTFSQTYVIPALLAQTTHTVAVVWGVTNTRTASFTVTAPPQVSFTPTSGIAGTVVTISTVSGFPFSANANITIYFGTTIVNSTQLDDRFGPTGMFTGTFTNLEFTVPTLAPGVYVLTVVDEYGASTGTTYTFTVLTAPVTTVALRATAYLQGDTLSFNIITTETGLGTITVTVKDPSGATWWTTTAWTLTGTTTKRVLYQDQLVNANPLALPADAPLGSWNWTITYTPTSTGLLTKDSALFTVSTLPDIQDVLDKLVTMEASIKGAVTTSEGKIIIAINTKAGTIMTDLDALEAAIVSIAEGMVTISTSLGEVQVDIAALDLAALDALGVDITAIKSNVATIKTNIGTVTTAVSNLDAKVTSLSGDVATVSTTLGTLQGTVTAIDGKVATIDTSVGTVQADISDVSAKVDTTPAWIAVVLAAVAAIAAIFAVITIRQKIAG